MICVEWIDKFNLGIHQIDDQHKQLIDIMNKLCSALNEGLEVAVIGEALQEMTDYANPHFSTEEKYFDEFHYPKAEEHKAWHRDFTKKVQALKEELAAGKKTVSVEAISFLGGWFIDHTQTFDRDYVPMLKEHGIQ